MRFRIFAQTFTDRDLNDVIAGMLRTYDSLRSSYATELRELFAAAIIGDLVNTDKPAVVKYPQIRADFLTDMDELIPTISNPAQRRQVAGYTEIFRRCHSPYDLYRYVT